MILLFSPVFLSLLRCSFLYQLHHRLRISADDGVRHTRNPLRNLVCIYDIAYARACVRGTRRGINATYRRAAQDPRIIAIRVRVLAKMSQSNDQAGDLAREGNGHGILHDRLRLRPTYPCTCYTALEYSIIPLREPTFNELFALLTSNSADT